MAAAEKLLFDSPASAPTDRQSDLATDLEASVQSRLPPPLLFPLSRPLSLFPLPPLPSRRQICISFRGRRRRRRRRRSRSGSNFILRLSVPTSFPRACAKFMSGLPPLLPFYPSFESNNHFGSHFGNLQPRKIFAGGIPRKGERGEGASPEVHNTPP